MKSIRKQMGLASIILFGLSISACNDSDASKKKTELAEEETILQVDASDSDNFVYYNLKTLEKVAVSDPKNSTEWHIGFKRTSIILNGGDAGPSSVAGALAAENTDFYLAGEPILAAFINAEPSNQLAQFEAATLGEEKTEYIEDENALAIDGDSIGGTHWYSYNFMTHAVSANADNWWLIRSAASNSYAQFRVTDLTQNSFVIDDISFELYIQENGDEEFSEELITVSDLDLTEGPVCYDIDAAEVASCEGTSWDLYFSAELEIYLNSGIYGGGSGAAFGPLALEDLSSFASGTLVPHWLADSTSGIFSEESWYAYNLEGNHKLWSNYNVYAIDTDTESESSLKVKAQILSYYSTEGASGHYSIRVGEF